MSAPHSRDAEQAVLGGLMLRPAAYWRIADRLAAEDFFIPQHAELFGAIAGMCRANKPCDAVTLGDSLESLGRIDAVGGVAYVLEIANATPGVANIVAYAEIVASHAEVRRVQAAGREIACIDGAEPSAQAAVLLTAAARPAQHSTQAVGDVLKEWYASLEARLAHTGELTGVPTGLSNLDVMTGGWQPGNLVLIAARPSMGKTAIALHTARAAAGNGHSVLIFTIEMTSAQLMARLVSSVSRISSDSLRTPANIEDEEWPQMTSAIAQIAELPIRFDESSTLTIDRLAAKAYQAHAKSPVRVIVVDYLQLMTPPRAERNDIAVGEITRGLKALAKALGATVVLLSQLNRKCEERADKRPLMSDLRDSGAIEQDADVIVMLYRDEQYNPQSADKGCVEIIIRKQRDGATGTVPARADLRIGQFRPIDRLPSADMPDPDSGPQRSRGFQPRAR